MLTDNLLSPIRGPYASNVQNKLIGASVNIPYLDIRTLKVIVLFNLLLICHSEHTHVVNG